jgi:hypothetical protein
VPLFGCFVFVFLVGTALAAFSRRHIYPVFAVGREYTMTKSSGMILDSFSWPTKWVSIREDTNKPGQVYSRFRHQRRQLGNDKLAG